MKRIIAASICLITITMAICSGCSTVSLATQPSVDVFDRIDAYVQAQMRKQRIPGLALGIVRGNKTVYLRGYGVSDVSGSPVTPYSPFVLASVSKSITALAVMQLVETGKVELDTPAVMYVRAFHTADEKESSAITVRQLLNQTSGLSTYSGNLLNYNNGGVPLDNLLSLIEGAELVSTPGQAFHYSNANFVLLACIVEHVSGQPYGDYVQSHIFQPLGMAVSSVERTQDTQQKLVCGFRHWFGFPVQMQAYNPVSCLNNISTAEEMTHYLIALINGGAYMDASVCSSASLALMMEPAAKMGDGVSYAMGFEVDSTQPYKVIRHPGDAPGYNANIAIQPDGNWGIVVLENCNWLGMEGETGSIISGIVRLLEGKEPSYGFVQPSDIMILFDVIYIFSFFFLIRAFVLLRRWMIKIEADKPERLRRRLIPVVISGIMVPACMVEFIPMAFSANWQQGFLNAPDFCIMMLGIAALLFALGAARTAIVFRRIGVLNRAIAKT